MKIQKFIKVLLWIILSLSCDIVNVSTYDSLRFNLIPYKTLKPCTMSRGKCLHLDVCAETAVSFKHIWLGSAMLFYERISRICARWITGYIQISDGLWLMLWSRSVCKSSCQIRSLEWQASRKDTIKINELCSLITFGFQRVGDCVICVLIINIAM